MVQWVKSLPPVQEMRETWVQSMSREDPLEEEMATHSSIFARKFPWTEESGGLHAVHRVAKESYMTEHTADESSIDWKEDVRNHAIPSSKHL